MALLSNLESGQGRVNVPNPSLNSAGGYTPARKSTKNLSSTVNSILGNVSAISGSIAQQAEQKEKESLQLNVNMAQEIGLRHSRQLSNKIKELDTLVIDNKLNRNEAIKQLNDFNIEVALKGKDGLSNEAKEAYDRTYLNSSITKINNKSISWASEQQKLDSKKVYDDSISAINELGRDLTPEQLDALKQGFKNIGLNPDDLEKTSYVTSYKEVEGDYSLNPNKFYSDGKRFYTDKEIYANVKSYFNSLKASENKQLHSGVDKLAGAIINDKNKLVNSINKPSDEDYYDILNKVKNASIKNGVNGENINLNTVLTPKEFMQISNFSPSKQNTIDTILRTLENNNTVRNLTKTKIDKMYQGNLNISELTVVKNALANGTIIPKSNGEVIKATSEFLRGELKKTQQQQDSEFSSFKDRILDDRVINKWANYVSVNKTLNSQSTYTEKIADRMTTNNFSAYDTAEEIINEAEMYKVTASVYKRNEEYSKFLASNLRQTYSNSMKKLLEDPKYSENGELNTAGKEVLLNRVMSAKTSTIKNVFNNKYFARLDKYALEAKQTAEQNFINESVSDTNMFALKDYVVMNGIKIDSQEEFNNFTQANLISTQGIMGKLASIFPLTDTPKMVLKARSKNYIPNEDDMVNATEVFTKKVLKIGDIDSLDIDGELLDNGDIVTKLEISTDDGTTDQTYYLTAEDIIQLSAKDTREGTISKLRQALKIKD